MTWNNLLKQYTLRTTYQKLTFLYLNDEIKNKNKF